MNDWITVTGWTLLHFIWQGTLVALVVAGTLHLMRYRSARARYAAGCAGLAVMLAAPAITARLLAGSTGVPAFTAAVSPAAPDTRAAAPEPIAVTSNHPGPATAFEAPAAVSRLDLDRWLPFVVAAWIGGVAILLLQLAGGCWRVRKLHAIAMLEPASKWEDMGRRLASQLGLSGALRIVDSTVVYSPTVIGWMRPVILLPIAAVANLTPRQVEAILAHEIAHIRRHDFLVNVLQTIAETLLFYHPAVWWLSSRIRAEREHCCDDIAVDVCGDAYAYAAALTEIAALGMARTPLAMAATGGSLLHRVRRLLGAPAGGPQRSASGIVIVGLALALVVIGGGLRLFVMAQSMEPANDTDHRAFGPRDLNRFLGFGLRPGPAQYATDDPRGIRAWGAAIQYPEGEMKLIGFTARSLIRDAYGLVDVPMAGAPGWMDDETFDLAIPSDVAVAANGISDPELVRAALKRYFENELNLTWHYETREFPVYALVKAGDRLGPHIRPTADTCLDAEKLKVRTAAHLAGQPLGQAVRFCGVDNDLFGLNAEKVTMHEFARDIRRHFGPLTLDRDVVDRTGLNGAFDFELGLGLLPLAAIGHHSPTAGALLYPFGVRSLFTALPQQLGLKLEESSADRQVLVIDHIDRPASTR